MRCLSERDIGYDTRIAKVPIVPAAILYDLGIGDDPTIRPTADCGYRAAESATTGPVAEGNVGAGAGATIGKSGGPGLAMKGGVGSAAVMGTGGLVVAALVAVNAVGDVIDPATGQVVAGVRTEDGTGLADARALLRGGSSVSGLPGENTTIGVVATNARLTQAQATVMAQMAHDGFARAISPSHTPSDGDAIFALATGLNADTPKLATIGARGDRNPRVSGRPEPPGGSVSLHLTVLLLYAGLLMTLGLWVSRRVQQSSEFFVAGRRLGPGLIFATLLAANIGAGSTVGAAGLGYRDGLSAWWWVGSAGLGSIVLAFWVGPRLRRVAAAHNLHTVGDFLEHRYGREVRATIAILLWIGTLAILAAQLMAMGYVLNG